MKTYNAAFSQGIKNEKKYSLKAKMKQYYNFRLYNRKTNQDFTSDVLDKL